MSGRKGNDSLRFSGAPPAQLTLASSRCAPVTLGNLSPHAAWCQSGGFSLQPEKPLVYDCSHTCPASPFHGAELRVRSEFLLQGTDSSFSMCSASSRDVGALFVAYKPQTGRDNQHAAPHSSAFLQHLLSVTLKPTPH